MSSEDQHGPLRLHLGCGAVLLEGYRNIDLPSEERELQQAGSADEVADITTLSYPAGSVDEIRLHHVFEHFDRATAVRLLIDWHEWLREGGVLRIETPDFKRSILMFFLRRDTRSRMKLMRHLYGSHEASWAVHKDGWYAEKFRRHLTTLGYERVKFERSSWRGTYNITAVARKARPLDREDLLSRGEELLRSSVVDDSEIEQRILATWIKQLRGPAR